jgi:hypothetical protein
MNRFSKVAIAMAGAALAVQAAFAGVNNNNLVLSINNNNGSGTTEFTVNLGQQSTFLGPNYDLSSFLGNFNSQYASAAALSLNVGVAGGQNGQGTIQNPGVGNDVFTTTLRQGNVGQYTITGSEGAPSINPTKATIGNAGSVAAGTIEFGSNVAIGGGSSFTSLFAKDPVTAGTAANNFTGDLGGANPLQTMTGGTLTLDLWKDTVTSSGTSGWLYQGDLVFDFTGPNPTLTWDASPIPEPSTFSLCAGAGLLGLAFRRHFRRKN